MVSLTTFLISVALGAILYVLFKKNKGKATLPPGPFPLPILGNILSMANLPQKAFYKWGETYGKMFTVSFGSSNVVVLNDPVLIREAFNDPNFSGRPEGEGFVILVDGPHGVLSSSGQEWVDQRRFTLRHLRDFGFGKNVMEELIMEEVAELTATLKSKEDQPISLHRRFNLIVFNSLWKIMSGKRYSHDDPGLSHLLDGFYRLRKEYSELFMFIMFFYPGLAKLFPKFSGWNSFMTMIDEQKTFIRESITEHQNNKPDDGQPRDFIDSYLQEIDGTSDENSSFSKSHGMKSLMAVCMDLFTAETISETTSNTLSWAVLYLTKFPEYQRKLQNELDSVVGRSRLVSLADRPNLPYVEAILLEVLRYSSIVPFGVTHTAMADVDFHGYHFPKGTRITANHYYVHFNPELWESPEKFNPERFLSADGKKVMKSENLMAFSVGKRQCLGETLARDEMFLFTTNIFQRFNVRLADDSVNVSVEANGIAMEPHPYSVVFNDRL